MFRSPISPPRIRTSAISSSRNSISADDSAAAFETFLPGIFTPNHQSKKKTATIATVTRKLPSNKRRNMLESRVWNLPDLLAKSQRAEHEEQDRHDDEDGEVRPVFDKMCAAQNDCAHERDEVGGRVKRAKGVKNPRHGFPRENKAGKENARQKEDHRHLQRLHLVFCFCSDEQAETEEREDINER